ncbi:MAG: nucleotidyl transferase [Chloroflexi bacterium]|nr:MAG: nucleotidyl transferase [Chloroflexota bacterium]
MLPCVVLAGGLGTRMRPLTANVPKSLVPVLGRPFAELQLEWLASQEVTDVIYSIGYRGSMVRAALGDGRRFGVTLTYVDEGNELLGSAGALRLALDQSLLPDAFFVLNGDSYLSLDFADVEATWRRSGRPVLMTVFRNSGRWDQSNAVLRDDGSVLYDKRAAAGDQQAPEWIDYGLSVITSEVIAAALPSGGQGDLADAMAGLSRRGDVAGYEAQHRFYEVGSKSGLHDLEAHLASLGASRP